MSTKCVQYTRFGLLVIFYLIVSLCAMAAQVWSDNRWVESVKSAGSPASSSSSSSPSTDTNNTTAPACLAQSERDATIPALPDLVHAWFPVSFGSTFVRVVVADAIIYVGGAITWLCGAIATRDDRLRVARRTLFLISCLFLLRCLTISVTGLPPSSRDCQPLSYRDDPREFLRVLLLNGPSGACTDLMFSGHTAICTVMVAWWWFQSRAKYGQVGWIGATLCWVLACFTFTASRLHYTADVIIGATLAMLLYTVWTFCRDDVADGQRFRRGARAVLGRLIAWVECFPDNGRDRDEYAALQRTLVPTSPTGAAEYEHELVELGGGGGGERTLGMARQSDRHTHDDPDDDDADMDGRRGARGANDNYSNNSVNPLIVTGLVTESDM